MPVNKKSSPRKTKAENLKKALAAAQSPTAPSKQQSEPPSTGSETERTSAELDRASSLLDVREAIEKAYIIVPEASLTSARLRTLMFIKAGLLSQDLQNPSTQGILASVSEICAAATGIFYSHPLRANWAHCQESILCYLKKWFIITTITKADGLAHDQDFFNLTYHSSWAPRRINSAELKANERFAALEAKGLV